MKVKLLSALILFTLNLAFTKQLKAKWYLMNPKVNEVGARNAQRHRQLS
jgi:hypothetical protein